MADSPYGSTTLNTETAEATLNTETAEDITHSPAVRTANGVRFDGVYTVLVLGNSGGNSDTMMLCSLDTNENKLSLVSIPRDTLVNVSWPIKKANSLFTMGGIDGTMEGVRDILGFEPDNMKY